jgi:hypothetical protein
MKVSILIGAALLFTTSASWLARAEPQHRGHGGGAAPAPKARPQPPPRPAGGMHRPATPKAHPQHPPRPAGGMHKPAMPKAHPQHPPKPAGGMHKPAEKKQKASGSADAKKAQEKKTARADAKKTDAKKEHTEKKVAKAETEKHEAKKKELAHKEAKKKARGGDGGRDPESINLLHAAHHKLHEADHDYGGHRLRALEHVGTALRHLGADAPTGWSGAGGGTMPQFASDNILREARSTLDMIRDRLRGMPAAAAGHGHARGAVDAAIREIDVALTVR